MVVIKRWLVVLLAGMALAGTLAACGGSGSNSGGSTTSSGSQPGY